MTPSSSPSSSPTPRERGYAGPDDPQRDETPAERLDRNYNELLQELRVAQTGVQILFAFLLSLPFLQGFHIDETDRKAVYTVTLLGAALATGFLLAPVPYHRIVFRLGLKDNVVRMANRMAIAGITALLVAMCGALFLVLDTLWSAEAAVAACVAFGCLCAALWYVVPARHLGGSERRDPAVERPR